MKQPNVLGENIFATSTRLPPELGLEKYIDHETQFEKAFLLPLQSILDVIGWSTEKRATLEAYL
jgi:hypothetical protein